LIHFNKRKFTGDAVGRSASFVHVYSPSSTGFK